MDENKKNESVTLTIKKENLWKYSTFILLAVLVIGTFMYFNKSSGTTAYAINQPSNNQPSAPFFQNHPYQSNYVLIQNQQSSHSAL